MHDPKLLRTDPERVKDGVRAKGMDPAVVDEWLALDETRRGLVTEVERKKADRNAASREIGAERQAGRDAGAKQERVRLLGEEISGLDQRLRDVDARLESLSLNIPNVPDPDVPRGGAEDNRVVRTWGTPVKHAFTSRTHDELGAALGLFDFERAARMSGPGFAVFTGRGAHLERALIQFMIELHVREHGYIEVSTPFLVKPIAAQGTGQLPKLAEDMYRTDADGLYLIPTAEVSITNLYADETMEESKLPVYHVG